MPNLVITALAPIGAALYVWRRPEPGTRARRLEVYLLWWLAAIGVGSVLSGLVHVLDGAPTAEDIGFTRGDGGFQFENAMGDLALGVCSLLCLRIRGTFWLAVLVFMSIQYYGDAVGHVYQWLNNDNSKSGNVGVPLVLDVLWPAVATVLYARWRRADRSTESGRPLAPQASVAQVR